MFLDGYKKLIVYGVTVVCLIVVLLTGYIDIDLFIKLLAGASAAYLIGQGIADNGKNKS